MTTRIFQFIALVLAIFLTGCRERPLPGGPIPLRPATDELPNDQQLQQMIDRTLDHTFTQRHLDVGIHAAWQILHGALPFGMRFQVYAGDERTGAMQWVLDGKPMKGWMLEHGTRNLPGGRRGLRVVLDPGDKKGQGHYDQWLAIMTQCRLKLDQPIKFQGRTYQLRDILQQAQWDLKEGKESSWTLIALAHYLDINARWEAGDGQTWTIEKIVQMEAEQDLNDSACGGTHRLIGMAMALDKYRQGDHELTGGWAVAHQRVQDAIEIARAFQQPDGSFSTDYLASNRQAPDVAMRLDTTGHTLEFLTLALEPHELAQPWVVRSVVALCDLFERAQDIDLDCGPLYHATHGLLEYRERRFGTWQYPED